MSERHPRPSSASVRAEFDDIALLSDDGASDRYDAFLLRQVPATARRIIDVGSGLGRLTVRLATPGREVLGLDFSSQMVARARENAKSNPQVRFECVDFLQTSLPAASFDVVITAATLHHMSTDIAVPRLKGLVAPGGRLIINDLRRDDGLADRARAALAFPRILLTRVMRSGSSALNTAARAVWAKHGAGETYLSFREARELAARLLPGAVVYNHWLWRYTIVWDRT